MSAYRIVSFLRMRQPAQKTHPAIAEVHRRTEDRLYGFFVVARLLVAPLIAGMAVWILANDHVLWRQVAMACVAGSVLTVSTFDLYNYRKRGLRTSFTITRNIVLMSFAGTFMSFATGALESPIIFVLILMALGASLFGSRRVALALVLGLEVPMVWLFAAISVYGLVPDLMPDVLGGGARTPRDDMILWLTAVMLTAVLVAMLNIGMRLREHVEAMLEEQVDKRDEALRLHAEQMRAMTTLSGEIAHELKNPLASVKGLAALVAKDLDGRSAERMTVLRREVDRMQSVLQEFLNFSRPFVPLNEDPLDMAELCRDVADLHAGVAEERGAKIAVKARGDASLVCDARKVKQVLINLVQNALDATPRGGTVVLEADGSGPEGVTARVLDEGPGLPEDLRDRVFEAGVTGKPDGSGLGLPVARLLARQHGGELELQCRESGGCVATLTLPRAPRVEEEAGDGPEPGGAE